MLVIIIALLAAAAVYQFMKSRQEKQRYPPPGEMVDVGGFRLHLNVMGSGQPTVILDAGMVSFSSNWAWVQPEIAKVTRVVAYDRAGLGWSDPSPQPPDAAQNARELHAALQKLGISAPYVLAGHSYGGLTVRAFAALYRNEVAGLVLVDGSHPDQWVRMGASSRMIWMSNGISSVLAHFGLFRLFKQEFKLLTDGLPPQQAAELMAFASTPGALSASANAAKLWDDTSRPFVNASGSLGDIPLIVLSVTEQPRMADKLTELQNELPALSSNSQHITVQGANHEGLVAKREHAQVVTDAILRVVQAVRTDQPLN
jgi:pimeloyl-ACP methyl ester carboxylesterase